MSLVEVTDHLLEKLISTELLKGEETIFEICQRNAHIGYIFGLKQEIVINKG